MSVLILYTRVGCHLCEEAKQELDFLRAEIPFDLRLVDIDSDPTLRAQFSDDVPVLFLDGRKVAKHRLDLKQLRRQLTRTRQGTASSGHGFGRAEKRPSKPGVGS